MSTEPIDSEAPDVIPPTEPLEHASSVEEMSVAQPRRRGRPPGSPNKPKPLDLAERPAPMTLADAAAASAPPNPQEQIFGKTVDRISGSSLVPNAAMLVGVSQESYWYWLGLRPDCLVHSITCAGEAFPMMNWEYPRFSMAGVVTQPSPMAGCLIRLTRDKIDLMRERLPRTVIRKMAGRQSEPGAGISPDPNKPFERAAWGQLITVPTAEELALARKDGRMTRKYQPSKNDRPAADFMYCVLCPDQSNPQRGLEIPPPLSVTGLVWPVSIEEREAATA